MASFEQLRYGVRKMIRQFDADLDSTIISMRDTDSAVFCLSQFKSGEWSSHCLDFFLMCRTTLTSIADAERIFAQFGQAPADAARSAMAIYDPRTREDVLCCMAMVFTSFLQGRRHESLALFRKWAEGNMTVDQFVQICQTRSPDTARKTCDLFAVAGTLTFDQFEVCALYCGMFGEHTLIVGKDPFPLLGHPAFDSVRAVGGRGIEAVREMVGLLGRWIGDIELGEADAGDMLGMLLRVGQVALRNQPKTTEATVCQPPARTIRAPRKFRLQSDPARRTIRSPLPSPLETIFE
jgi:hypothetical protein